MEVTRHFTATTFVVYRDRVLLHWHKKLKMWLPVGGHVDRDELPEEAARREVQEEAGLDVILYHATHALPMADAQQLIQPAHIVLEDINEFHQHIDLIYFAQSTTDQVDPAAGETEQVRWFTAQELREWELPDNARQLALEALHTINGSSLS